jgi:hypothetical protein
MFAPTNDLPPITEEELNTVDYPIKEEADEVLQAFDLLAKIPKIPKLKPEPIGVTLAREQDEPPSDELINLMTSQEWYGADEEAHDLFKIGKEAGNPPDNLHVIKQGENLWNIAKANNVTVSQLVEWNNIENPDSIKEGGTLLIGGDYDMESDGKEKVKAIWKPAKQVKTPVTTKYLADNYNASPAIDGVFVERNQYMERMDRHEKMYQQLELSDEIMANIKTVDELVIKHAKDVFSIEMGSTGIDIDELRDSVRRVYGAETNYGTSESLVSPTGAQGELQVLASTMFDLHRLGVLGKGFRKAVGLTEAQLKAIVVSPEKDKNGNNKVNQEATRKFLLSNTRGNVLVGMAKILNMVRATQNRNKEKGVSNGN